jgi:hypothetical protein
MSITVTCTSARSRSALACRTTKTRGSGIAGSILSHPGEHQSGTAASLGEARADFERAWDVFLSKRAEADFKAWRDDRDWSARKYALWDAGKRLEPPSCGPGKPAHRFRKCPCGDVFDMYGPEEVFVHVPHIAATEAVLSARRHAEALHDSACPNART